MAISYLILCIILCFMNNFLFSLLFIPIVYVYYRKKKKERKKCYENKIEITSTKKNNILIIKLKYYYQGFIRYYIYRVSQVPSHHLRNFIYKHILFMNIKGNVAIYAGAEIRHPYKIEIGDGTIIGDNVILDGRNRIYIGSNVNFSSNVSIWTEQHDHRDPLFRCTTQKKEQVKINDRVWIGPNSIILHSVTIGEGAVVAANSVVTKDVPPYTIVAGTPAKEIGKRNTNLIYELKGDHLPFR